MNEFENLSEFARTQLGSVGLCRVEYVIYQVAEDLGEFTLPGNEGSSTRSGYTLNHNQETVALEWTWPDSRDNVVALLRMLQWGSGPVGMEEIPPGSGAPAYTEDGEFPYPDEWIIIDGRTKKIEAYNDDDTPMTEMEQLARENPSCWEQHFAGDDYCGLAFRCYHRPRSIHLTMSTNDVVAFQRNQEACLPMKPDPDAHACVAAPWTLTLPDGRQANVPSYETLLDTLRTF